MKTAAGREPGQTVTPDYRESGTLRYDAEDREIVGHNGTLFNNRPLYGPANSEGVVLAGDRPFIRLLGKSCVHGAFAAGIVRSGVLRWFHEWAEVEARYRCGRMTWRISDPAADGVAAALTVLALAEGAGFAARLAIRGAREGDRLAWTFGGARTEENPRTRWDPVSRGNPQVCRQGGGVKAELMLGPMPEWRRGNEVVLAGAGFRVAASPGSPAAVAGRSDRGGVRTVAAHGQPEAGEEIALHAGEDEIHWSFAAVEGGGAPDRDPARDFGEALARATEAERIRAETPDPRFNAAVAAVGHAIDGTCERDPCLFRHGCMSFSMRFLGWRVIHGATVVGWHGRVRENAAYYTAAQRREPEGRTGPAASPELRLCHEGEPSRFYGRGRILKDQAMYDMQTQFFDQTICDWRWTAEPGLESILRPALELHLEWARDCFDPDDDGLYESYINTLPTDSMWYNGGGGVEQSVYVWTGHRAAADMARRAGDAAAAARHEAQAEKIRRALRNLLWLGDRGHFGAYKEQGGHGRVHADAWTYSQFMPVDAGLLPLEEAWQALYFTEWGLERIRLPFGGVLCQQSNWIPAKWSTRDMFSGDLCHLALAYFKAGLAQEGWDLLQGVFLESCYASAMPGGFSHIGAGADFGDSVHMFARVVAEGLFGFEPDYPNGVVRWRPVFPDEWERADYRCPDFALDYRRDGDIDRYRLELAREAAVEFRILIRAAGIRRVLCDGVEILWKAEAGCGCTLVRVERPVLRPLATPPELPPEERPADRPLHLIATIEIELTKRLPELPATHLETNVGDEIRLEGAAGSIRDFHQILEDARPAAGGLCARVARKPGHHLVLVGADAGALPRWRVFKVKVSDPVADAALAARTPRAARPDAAWTCLDLAAQANGDVREIFRQRYLSPRPKTCSVRLGVDGYSGWTFPHWKEGPPEIDLSLLDHLASGPDRILTPQGAPFARPRLDRNIAFTSLWDNWPTSVTVPVNRSSAAVWLLVCGSTFPMQTRIANAEFRFRYADGAVETLELVPPLNFWSLCPWGGVDYSYETDGFCLPETPPPTVSLGANCRAMVLSWTLRPGVPLQDIALEALSQDVVIGLMGVSLTDSLLPLS